MFYDFLWSDPSGSGSAAAETNCTPWSQNRNLHLSLVAFKGTIRRNPFRGEHIYHEKKDKKYKMLFNKRKF